MIELAVKVKPALAVGVDPVDARRALTAFKAVHGREAGSWREAFGWISRLGVAEADGLKQKKKLRRK